MSQIGPICTQCAQEMVCEENGVTINDPAVGDMPATYWSADRYACPRCGFKVITGTADKGCPAIDVLPEDLATSLEFTYAT